MPVFGMQNLEIWISDAYVWGAGFEFLGLSNLFSFFFELYIPIYHVLNLKFFHKYNKWVNYLWLV